MSAPPTDLDDRVARLAARRAASRPAAAVTAVAASEGSTKARLPLTMRRKKNHPAWSARLITANLTTAAFLSIIVALAVQQTSYASATYAAAKPRGRITPLHKAKPKVIVKNVDVHHKMYFDANGNPIPADKIPKNALITPATAPGATTPATTSVIPNFGGAPSAPSSGGGATHTTYGSAPSSGGGAPAPAPSAPPAGGGGGGTPPATSSQTTPHTTPATTPATTPRTTPTTVHVTPPPPPPPPPCTATTCP